jgi:hypothetical protein
MNHQHHGHILSIMMQHAVLNISHVMSPLMTDAELLTGQPPYTLLLAILLSAKKTNKMLLRLDTDLYKQEKSLRIQR